MNQRTIGDMSVGAIGLGAMPLSVAGRPPIERARETVRAALDAGVTFIDVADAYSLDARDFGHNETLVATLLRELVDNPADVLVATKGGHVRDADGGWQLDGRPEYLKRAAQDSARRLGVEAIGLYQLHRPDPAVPFTESVGALADLVAAGTVRMAGISNVDAVQIGHARDIVGPALVSVQNEFSPAFRSSEDELALCRELGLAFLPWSPLGGMSAAAGLGRDHVAFAEIAAERGVSPQRVCLAWILAQGPHVVAIPGASRPATITDSAAAADLQLTAAELARLRERSANAA